MNIVLIGYRCSGKTHVGRLLANHLKRDFLDTDRLVEERTGIPIPSYVSLYGWRDFRRVERRIVRKIAPIENSVIATGGGIVTDPGNVTDLRRNGWVVWLAAGGPAIRARMALASERGDARPPLAAADPLEEVDTVLEERIPLYERASDFRVQTDGLSPEAVACAILKARWRTRLNL